MNYILCNSINRLLSKGKILSELSMLDIWSNTSNAIYNYYADEQEFFNKFSMDELKKLNEFVCPDCGVHFVRLSNTGNLCNSCIDKIKKKNSPNTHSKDSKEYQDWYKAQQAACPNNMDHNSKEYQNWYNSSISNSPSCMDTYSKEYQDWYKSFISANPANMDKESKEYQNWYNSQPQCMDTDSKEYNEWYNNYIQAAPQYMDPKSEQYQKWYKNTISNSPSCMGSKEYQDWYDSQPQCMDKDTKEYQDWYNKTMNRNPNTHPKESKEYQNWYASWKQGELNKEWHKYSIDEMRLMSFNLSYVVRNEIGEKYLSYESDDGSIHNFYPDFMIKIGYSNTDDTDWEFIEYKGDHLLQGIHDDQAQTHNKYNQCHDKVGFVPTSLSWLFELCILNPNANKLWKNPRILAYVIYDIWKNNNLPVVDWSKDSDIVFKFIADKYNQLNEESKC